jgi:hypothetical protein
MSMGATVATVSQKVQRILTDMLGSVQVGKGGTFYLTNESAAIFVEVQEWGDGTVVKIVSPMLRGVRPTDDVFRWVAIDGQSFWFTHARVVVRDGGLCDILMEQDLYGDTLDPEELRTAVTAVAVSANDLDDELQSRFGGIRWTDDD